MPNLSIEDLYKLYIDESKDFALDIFEFFGADIPGLNYQDWKADFGYSLPTFDHSKTRMALARREEDITHAVAQDELARTTADRVYQTELDKISVGVGSELEKVESILSGTGIRSGDVEKAQNVSLASAFSQADSLADKFDLTSDELDMRRQSSLVDSALALEDVKHEEKSKFYDEVMEQVSKISELGGFAEMENPCSGIEYYYCGPDECAADRCECSYNLGNHPADIDCLSAEPAIDEQITGNEIDITNEAYCMDVCPLASHGMVVGGLTCFDSCLGTGPMGGEFDPHIFMQEAQEEADFECQEATGFNAEWNAGNGSWDCVDTTDYQTNSCCQHYMGYGEIDCDPGNCSGPCYPC
jgi:hypothetical protein